MPGTLFVVATPIGNLEDLTFRALRTLREVHLIAAEDTRRTSRLLAHYEIRKPLVSLHEHNEARETPRLIDRLKGGEDIALVSDAGTPGISDPGQHLVGAARAAGIRIVPIPGASAITSMLSAAGLPGTSFKFMGFPPSSGEARQHWFDVLKDEPSRVVFFEAPHRIARTLSDLRRISGERPILIGRELTKIHEELVIWNSSDDLAHREAHKGEFVVVLGQIADTLDNPPSSDQLDSLFGLVTKFVTNDRDAAVRAVAAIVDQPVRRVRSAIKKARILSRRREDGDA